jgi:transposase
MPKWTSRDAHGKGAFIIKIATVGLDLAKNVLQLHAVDSQGHLVARKQLKWVKRRYRLERIDRS